MTKLTDVTFTLNNGVKIPALGLGTYNDSPEEIPLIKEAVIAAIKAGYRHIDTAWVYNTEKVVGEALREVFSQGIVKREDLFITSKVGNALHNDVERSLDESLKDLGVDYVDLYLQHWPLGYPQIIGDDGQLIRRPVNEKGEQLIDASADNIKTYKQLEKIYKETDKVKSIGVSNYSIPKLEELLKHVDVVPAVNQIESHPQLTQSELVDYLKKKNILITAYSPLGKRGAPNLQIPIVQDLIKKYNVSGNEILNSFHVKQGRIVIPRSVNTDRIKSTLQLVDFTDDELDELNKYGDTHYKRFNDPPWAANIGFDRW